MTWVGRDDEGKIERIVMLEEVYSSMGENYEGMCLGCGAVASQCEPDAENYTCESCGEQLVTGLEMLLIEGVIEFTVEEEDYPDLEELDA